MTATSLQADIADLIRERGPLTGADIRAALGPEQSFEQWRTCMTSPLLTTRRVGRCYLRLDEKVDGYARLSPSILREFLTYSIVGLSADPATLAEAVDELTASVRGISAAKLRVATRVVNDVVSKVGTHGGEALYAVLLAGDIVYQMAHDAPRTERSTGQMVRGSDLDLVVIVADSAPPSLEQQLDDAIYRQKYRYLINPSTREEIDYTIKRMSRVRRQVEFSTFKDMVPCKILDEAVLLAGAERLFDEARALLAEQDIPRRLSALEHRAVLQREGTEQRLLAGQFDAISEADRNVFCGTEELEEFD